MLIDFRAQSMRWLPYFQGVDETEQAMAGLETWQQRAETAWVSPSSFFEALSLLLGSYTCYCYDDDIRPALSSEEFCH